MYDTYFKNADTEDKHNKQFHRIECWKRKDGIKSGTKLQALHEKEKQIPSPIVEKTKNVLLVCETNPLCILWEMYLLIVVKHIVYWSPMTNVKLPQ